MRKCISILLALTLCLSMSPAWALAGDEAETESNEGVTEDFIDAVSVEGEKGQEKDQQIAFENDSSEEAVANTEAEDMPALEQDKTIVNTTEAPVAEPTEMSAELNEAVSHETVATDGISASDYTADQAISWAQGKVGISVGYDDGSGYYQCVEFIQAYYEYLGVGSVRGNGRDYATNTLPSGWTRTNGGTPQKGDILVYNNPPYGHVCIYESDYVTYSQDGSKYGATVEKLSVYYKNICGSGYYWGCIHPNFTSATFTLDINGLLDNNTVGNTDGFGTFDIYINGQLAANNVTDYYRTDLPVGTTYTIGDIKPVNGKAFGGITTGAREGTINGNTEVRLSFNTIPDTPGVEPIIGVYQGHTYYFIQRNSSWYAARYLCEKMGGHLVSIETAAENEYLWNFTGNAGVWIGLTDQDHEGIWQWPDGSSLSYSNWAGGEPNNYAGNNEGCENYGHQTTNGAWNDSSGYTLRFFVCEFDKAYTITFDANGGKNAPATQEKGYGQALTLPSAVPVRPCHTFLGWAKSQTAAEAEYQPGDSFSTDADATLYAVWAEGEISEWSAEKPAGADASAEEKTQYRYADRLKTEWTQTGEGTIDYVSGWPGGFDTANALYSQYNKTAKSASENATQKTDVSSAVIGYIYWHWCRGTKTDGPANRFIDETQTGEFCAFHAFFSAADASHYDGNGVNGGDCFCFVNGDACRDSYWWFRIPVYRQTYQEYKAESVIWSEWSEWSDTEYTPSDTRQVERRMLYRYLTDVHSWNDGVVTKAATYTDEGVMTYTCLKCGKTRTEAIPRLTPTPTPTPTPTTAKAPKTTLAVDKTTLNSGDVITVSVNLVDNPGIVLLAARVVYDTDVFSYVDGSLDVSSSILPDVRSVADKNYVLFDLGDDRTNENYIDDGLLGSFRLIVNNDVTGTATTTITVAVEEAYNIKYTEIYVQKDAADIAIVGSEPKPVATATPTAAPTATPKPTAAPTATPAPTPNVSAATIVLSSYDEVYTGAAIEPSVSVTLNGTPLQIGVDVIVLYSNNVSVGTATVSVIGIGSYAGAKAATFSIQAKPIS